MKKIKSNIAKKSLPFFAAIALFVSCEKETESVEINDSNGAINESYEGKKERPRLYSTYNYLGSGYDVMGHFANEISAGNQVIDIDKFKSDNPTRLISESPFSQRFEEIYGENAYSYLEKQSLKVNAGISVPGFKASLDFASSSSNKFDSRYIYASYNLLIKHKRFRFNSIASVLKNYLTDDFKNDLNRLTPAQIVQFYGTHVLVDIYTGAKLEAEYESETKNTDRSTAARVGIKAGVKKVFNVEGSSEVSTSSSSKNFNQKLKYKTFGGDPTKGLIGTLNLDSVTSKLNLAPWQSSSNEKNAVLIDISKNGMILIYDLVSDVAKRDQLKAYINSYVNSNKPSLRYENIGNLKDGNFVRNRFTEEVFFMFENKLRYIRSPQTLYGLFNISNNDIGNVNPGVITSVERGVNLEPDNDLKEDVKNGKVYLREGNVLRWIPNITIYNKYRFNNNARRPISGTNGYVVKSNVR